MAFYGAHHKRLNEDRPTLSAAEMWANNSSFWKYNGYNRNICGYSRGFLEDRGVKRRWGCCRRQLSLKARMQLK